MKKFNKSIFNPFDYINPEKIKNTVHTIKDRYPDWENEDICRELVRRKSRICAGTGALSALPSSLPGLGTLVTIAGGTAIDLGALVYFLSELTLEIATVYNRNPSTEATVKEALWVLSSCFGVESATLGVSKVAIINTSKHALVRIIEKLFTIIGGWLAKRIFLKVVPVIGSLINAYINTKACKHVGREVVLWYKTNLEQDIEWTKTPEEDLSDFEEDMDFESHEDEVDIPDENIIFEPMDEDPDMEEESIIEEEIIEETIIDGEVKISEDAEEPYVDIEEIKEVKKAEEEPGADIEEAEIIEDVKEADIKEIEPESEKEAEFTIEEEKEPVIPVEDISLTDKKSEPVIEEFPDIEEAEEKVEKAAEEKAEIKEIEDSKDEVKEKAEVKEEAEKEPEIKEEPEVKEEVEKKPEAEKESDVKEEAEKESEEKEEAEEESEEKEEAEEESEEKEVVKKYDEKKKGTGEKKKKFIKKIYRKKTKKE